jgi:serine protease Do
MDDKRVIRIIKRVMPAVVSIAISKKLADLEKEIPADVLPGVALKPSGKARDAAKNETIATLKTMADVHGMVEVGGGSGCIVDPNGLILTNKHVVSDTTAEYTVILNDGRRFPAVILSRDPVNDVAILKIDTTVPPLSEGRLGGVNAFDSKKTPSSSPLAGGGLAPSNSKERLPCLELGDATQLELGESVIAIGNALGMFKNTVSLGIVSGLSRAITAQADPDAPAQELRGLIQTDAAINPGNSGGPLVDRDGRVIGVNAAIVSGAQSIGFAIPVNAARRDLADIQKCGRICRPLLGLRYLMVDDKLQAKMNLPVNYGALVTNEGPRDSGVVPGSPAATAGLREKDIVLTLDGQKLDREHPIQDFLENRNVGDRLELVYLRNGKELKAIVTLAERR